MELGQILHANPVGIRTDHFVEALITAIRSEIACAYWNVNQKAWKGAGHGDIGGNVDTWSEEWNSLTYDTGIPGIEWRGYYNWGGCPEDSDWDQSEANKPNFSFEDVEVRWYKHFGRSMNVNVCWPADKWQRWLERVMQTIRAFEQQRPNWHGHQDPVDYPDPAGKVSTELTSEDLRYVALLDKISTLEAQLNSIACVCLDVANGAAPKVDPKDWRWCNSLDWVTRLGLHALKAPGKLELHDYEHTKLGEWPLDATRFTKES